MPVVPAGAQQRSRAEPLGQLEHRVGFRVERRGEASAEHGAGDGMTRQPHYAVERRSGHQTGSVSFFGNY